VSSTGEAKSLNNTGEKKEGMVTPPSNCTKGTGVEILWVKLIKRKERAIKGVKVRGGKGKKGDLRFAGVPP